jgi:hypothetical protein
MPAPKMQEPELVPMNSGAVQIIYDGDGNRVKRIVGYRPSS